MLWTRHLTVCRPRRSSNGSYLQSVKRLEPSRFPQKNLIFFSRIGSRGYFFFLLFQCFINGAPGSFALLQLMIRPTVDVDGLDDRPGKHLNRSLILGVSNGPYIPFPSHSFLGYLGPQTYILMLDCRCVQYRLNYVSPQFISGLIVRKGKRTKYAAKRSTRRSSND